MSAEHRKILLTGATGFIGGTVLSYLLDSHHAALQHATITCLVRGEDRVSKLKSLYGDRVRPELYNDLDDTDRIIEAASQNDIVINTTTGYHLPSVVAAVDGLAKRRQSTGRDVFLIHTSGTTNLADRPFSRNYRETRIFDDSQDDIYGYEKELNAREPYVQRTTELAAVDRAIETSVNAIVIMSPTIYGIGTGAWNRHSMQVQTYTRAAIANGQSVVVGDGSGIWDNVHVADLAELYRIVLLNILTKSGADLPFGKKGIIFSGADRHTWREMAEGVGKATSEAGKVSTAEVKSVSLQEAADLMINGMADITELGFSSNSRTTSSVGKSLGWKPTRGKGAFKRGFQEELDAVLSQASKPLEFNPKT